MIPFSEWLKFKGHVTEFSFRKVEAPDLDKFFITMADVGSENVSFEMTMTPQGKWDITEPAPAAITELKDLLIKIIRKHCPLTPLPFFRL